MENIKHLTDMENLQIGDMVTVELIPSYDWESPKKCIHAIVAGIYNEKYCERVHIHTDELTEQKHFNGIYSGHYMIGAYKITKE